MGFITTMMALIWNFINSIQVPLLGITFGQLFLSLIVIGLSIAILQQFLGMGRGGFAHYMRDNDPDGRHRK